MSTAEFGLTSQAQLLSSFPQMPLQQPLQESGTLARRYEALSRLSHSLVSQRPEDLPRNLDALTRPLLDFDFLDPDRLQTGFKRSALALHWDGSVPSA
jgi:hypothetical protein